MNSSEALLNSLREPAAVLDHNGRIHVVNAPWMQVNAEQALAGERFSSGRDYLTRCREILGDETVKELAQGVRDVLGGRSQAFTLAYACGRPDAQRHFELVASALPTDDGLGALIVQYDITERERHEAASRQLAEKLRYVLELLPEGYWDWDLEADQVHYSERWYESLGYAPSDVGPGGNGWLALVHEDDRERVREALYGYSEGRYPVYQCEVRVRRKNGSYRWNLDRGRIVARDARGKPLRIIGMEIDITERKEAELVIAEQSRRLMDLSTPLIPISDRVVVMPLIGAVDPERAEQVISTLLHGLSRAGATVAILDITGVGLIDSHVAGVLVNAAKAVELLGAQVVLTGVRPEVATILVGLGVDWGNIVMRGTLQAGIAYATSVARARTVA